MAWNYFNQSDIDESVDPEELEAFMKEYGSSISDEDEDYEMECSDSEDDEEVLQNNVYKMQMQKYDLFKSQNQETGHFDVTFVIDGKHLYANKYPLITSSETFNAWLSDRWTSTNDPIKIETYSFDVFYQLCTFIYSGGCKLTAENIFQIIDAAEFFGIQLLKDYCDTYLMQRRSKFVNEKNLMEMMDLADKYLLPKFTKYVDRRVLKNLEDILEEEKFLSIKKCHLLRLFETQKELYDYVSKYQLLEALIKWTEHYVQKKHEPTIDDNFDYEEMMKDEFSEFLPHIKFHDIPYDCFVEIFAEKLFLLAPSDLVSMFPECNGREDQLFKAVYELAESRALKTQKASSNKTFDLQTTIKEDLVQIIPVTKFSDMGIDFVIEFLVPKDFLFSCKELLKILAECYRHDDNQEEKVFKAMYEVAEKEVLQKHKKVVANFKLAEAIKAEMAEFLPLVKFYLMDKKFLMVSVVAKEILTHEQAFDCKIIKVEIKSDGRTLMCICEDKLDILDTVGKKKVEIFSHNEMKQRFIKFKITRPSIPSVIIKNDSTEWYLCLEWDGILAAKHRTLVTETDYLISELKSSDNYGNFHENGYFRIKKNSNTALKVTGL